MPRSFDLTARLQQRRADNLFRQRLTLGSAQTVEQIIDGQSLLSFCSNDYLGLASHPKVIEAMQATAAKYGVGAGASHLVNGHHQEHHLLEQELAEFTGYPKVLLYSTGYMANLGVVNALLSKSDRVLEDRLNHASLLDAGLSCGAQFKRYRHNDVSHLSEYLSTSIHGDQLVVTDGVFSMDGDVAPLAEMAPLARQHQAWMMVDDAHGLGTRGPQGRGTVFDQNLGPEDVQVLVGTLGKAFGTFGAFVCGSDALIETLVQFSRTYIYTTALPPAVAAATRASLRLLQEGDDLRQHLNQLVQRFRSEVERMGYQLWPSDSPIQPIIIGEAEQALALSEQLRQDGLLVTAIRPPTVPAGTARLRVTFSATHTDKHLDRLLDSLFRHREVCL